MTPGAQTGPRWWQTRWFELALIMAAIVPLLWPGVAPLTDLPGHLGSYRILAEAGRGPLARHYAVHWALIGNLGVEGPVLALAPLLGIELATKLVVMAIPALTVAAMLWVAREAHGRLPPTAAFALPLAYAFPFQLGFVNFALAAAFALGGLALWLILARRAPAWVRVALFVPISCLVWLCHSFGWAMLGLFVFGAEWMRQIGAGQRWWRAALCAGLMCVPMALPAVAMALHIVEPPVGDTGDWLNWAVKLNWLVSLLRERWQLYDIISVAVLMMVLWGAFRSRACAFSPLLGVPALLALLVFLALPRIYDGGAYVDMRLLPYAVALGLLAIRLDPDRPLLADRLAIAATAFFALRLLTTTIAFALLWQGQARELRALNALPSGSAVLVLENEPAKTTWLTPRLTHLAGIAIARRRIFTNEQWAIEGQQLTRPLHPAAAPFDRDPSQIVYPADAGYQITDFDQAIAGFDRGTFGYVWTIGFPAGRARAADLVPIWSNRDSAVYRVTRSSQNAVKRAPVER